MSKPTTGDIELATLLRAAMRGMDTRKKAATLTVPDSEGVESLTSMQRLKVLWIDGVWRKGIIIDVSIATNPACAVPKALTGCARVAVLPRVRLLPGGVG